MAGYQLDGKLALMGSAFALGVTTGLLMKGTARQVVERVRAGRWRREQEGTVTYDQNLPDTLARREPRPEAGQPRFGGTGAIGVHPAAANAAQAD